MERALIHVLMLMMFAQASAIAAVRLRATPQKFREFYSNGDARIPLSVRKQFEEPTQIARLGGTRWRLENNAVIRDSVPKARLSFRDGLPVGRLRAIAITTDGAVWAGGDEGLVRFENGPPTRGAHFCARKLDGNNEARHW